MNTQKQAELSRRDFLKNTGKGVAAVAAGCKLTGLPDMFVTGTPDAENAWAMLIDTTRCVGCGSCSIACREANQLPDCTVEPDHLDCYSYTYVDHREVVTEAGEQKTVHVKRQCMHCLYPACVSACTVGALSKSPEGPVVYDASKCIGCRYCQYACPFGVPTYEWNSPVGLIHKCQLCVERLKEGEQPACIAACPSGALRFGKRKALLAEAHAKIASNPGRYIDHVYGEHEGGGTSMLYLASVSFDQLGLPDLGTEPIPHYAEAVMHNTPVIGASVAMLASGLYWVMRRRELRLEQSAEAYPEEESTS